MNCGCVTQTPANDFRPPQTWPIPQSVLKNQTTMHFTIERQRLIKMLKSVDRKLPGVKHKDANLRIYACAARVFVEANGQTAGEEALVLRDGGCTQPAKQFLELLKSYASKDNVTIEADERKIKIVTFTIPSTGYTSDVKPPAKFFVGRVTDTWIAGGNK